MYDFFWMDLFLDTNYNHRIFTFQSARIFLSRQQTRLLFLYWNCRDWSYQSKYFVFGWQFVAGQTGLHHLIVGNSKIVLIFSHQSVNLLNVERKWWWLGSKCKFVIGKMTTLLSVRGFGFMDGLKGIWKQCSDNVELRNV